MNAERRRWGTFAAVTVLVVSASLVPVHPGGSERVLLGVGLDKWAHGVGYAAVAFAFARARTGASRPTSNGRVSVVPHGRGSVPLVTVLGAIVVGFAVGVGVELLQTQVATRTPSVADAVANAVGAVLGGGAWLLARR